MAATRPSMIRCLVVDDDLEIRGALQDYLQRFGMQVAAAADGVQMRQLLSGGRFDIAILDLMLPGEDGLSLCRWVQDKHRLPAIMLTAQGDPASRVVGLEMGADDYLGKPFEPRELVARIHAVLRRGAQGTKPGPADARSVRFAGWQFDRVARQLLSPEQVVLPLSNAEYRLLAALVERAGRVLTRDQLIEATRAPGVEVNDRSIDLAVSRLRGKLCDTAREARLIVTVRGEGYLFNAPIEP
jgi:two-component system OmpR family response regulator